MINFCNSFLATNELDCVKVCVNWGVVVVAQSLHWGIRISFCLYLSVCSVAGYCYRAAWRGVNMISRDLRALVRSLRRH